MLPPDRNYVGVANNILAAIAGKEKIDLAS
jgi:hypothetical protein